MARPKKDGKYLNVFIDKSIYESFENLCDKLGQSKTLATERALSAYIKTMSTENGINNHETK